MKIAFNPSTVGALITPPNNKDITFDLRGHNIFARGVKFCGTDTNTWRDIKINNVSIGSNILDLRNGNNTTLTNINGIVTINSTWRPVVDNLTSNSTTSSLSANQGRILKALIDGKSNSGHTHDDRYLKLTGGTMQLGEGLKFHANNNYFGTNADARIISLLGNNVKVCDGGLIIDERTTLGGKEYVTELLRIRDSEFKWRGSNILHSGNSYINGSTITINGSSLSIIDQKVTQSFVSSGYTDFRAVLITAETSSSSAGYTPSTVTGQTFITNALQLSPQAGNLYLKGSAAIGTTNFNYKLNVNGDIGLLNTGSIRNLAIGGGIYWNPYVESASDRTDAASITLVKSGVAGGTTLVLSQMNDTNDTIQFQTNGSARLYHNSYPILTAQNTYVNNNKGYINGTEITQVNNSSNARKLVNWYSARPTSLNEQFGDGSLRIFHATPSTTEGKCPDDATVLHLAWDNNGGWDAQLALAHEKNNKIYFRSQNSSTWSPWKTLAFTTDIPSSLKNPYSLTTFGVVYDGSAAKTVTTSTFVSQLSEDTRTVTDGTMFITSWASNSGFADTNAVNIPYKRKAARLWDYIKAKTNSLYAVIGHNHDDRYLKLTGGVLKGQIILPDIDVNTSYTGSIIIGASNTENLGIDGNEIMARNNGKASTLHLNNEGGVVQLGAVLRTNSNIAYIGSQSTQNMIKFINNTRDPYGNGIAIGGGGLTIIGSGKSSDVIMSQHSSGGDKNMIIAGDGNIDFYSNLQNGWKYGKHMYLDTNGFLFTPSYINIGGNENNNSSPDRVWGSNSSDSYLRSYRTSALKVSYANSAGSASKVYGQVGATGSHELVRCDMNYNDQFRIIAGSNGDNNGWAEIATADDGSEPIYIRQYIGVFNSVKRTLTLLDGSGNTIFPGNVGIGTTSPVYKLHVNGNICSSGQIIREGYSTIWAQGRNVALLRETSVSGYHTLWSLKTTNGSWDFGEYNTSGWNNVPVLSYITDSNYNSGNNVTTYQIKFPLASGTVALTSYGGDSSHPIFLGYLNLDHGNDGTISSSFSCLGYTVPFTYTRGGNYCRIYIPDTLYQTFYIRAAIASVNYSGGGMDTWVGDHRGDGAWWLHCYASGLNEVRVKGFCQRNSNNDSWWGGNPLWSGNNGANRITVCIFGNVTIR